MKRTITPFLLLLLLGTAYAGSPTADPTEKKATDTILTGPIRIFQNYLSPADGNRCPMTPSCSSYALESARQHGAIMGWIMTCDRLLRCGRDELKHCAPKMTRDGIRCPDLVENNDFWWK